ncbi:MAG TPA: class I SAM-dependent methyltransferase [Pyrinomonadaceae bacterium]
MSQPDWSNSITHKRAVRALARQLDYQERKSKLVPGREAEIILQMQRASKRVRDRIESFKPIAEDARVIEVGSGAHGLIFYFGARNGIGVDPLAVSYASLFPQWQQSALTVAAVGEQLPFPNNSFDVVICDNVVDHAESPVTIVKELVRILVPGGLLYFTVNVHHTFYSVAAQAHATWRSAGVPFEIAPFADHTVHLTPPAAKRMFAGLPLRVLSEKHGVAEAKEKARTMPPRHLGDRLKRLFYKNALFEIVAEKLG